MSSLVIYGRDFDRHVDNGLTPQFFKYRFLAEGDSWMDRSSLVHTSLLQKLAQTMDAAGDDVLIINLANFGNRLRKIESCLDGDFRQWLTTQFNWRFDAVLLSAGGNDFLNAARGPDAGRGILRNLNVEPEPPLGRDCLNRSAVEDLVKELDPCFAKLYAEVQSSRHAGVPIFLNCYDTPTARYAPVIAGTNTWLAEGYDKNAIPQHLWPDLTAGMFGDLRAMVIGWAKGRASVHPVPTMGTLVPAAAGSTGSNGDWLNEIHPNSSGWKKLATVWRESMSTVLA